MSETVADGQPHPLVTALKLFTSAYRVELILFAFTFVVLSFFSSQRFLRQSAAPHFVYQAQALIEGRLDIDPQVLPNIEDWACVRDVGGVPTRCTRPLLPTDKWYSSFPAFPAVVMLPFVAIHGYQFNDTSFGVLWAALAVALFYSLLRLIATQEAMDEDPKEHIALALLLAFGTVFFYCAIRGEVWFSAEVMGVAFTCLYARNALRARRPVLAGLFFSMAVMTRTPLLFTGIFFVLEALAPTRGARLEELKALAKNFAVPGRKLALFAAGAAPLALAGAIFNQVRFGSFTEFGHRFFYENRVNRDIDLKGLFHFDYLARNLDAAFLKLPSLTTSPWTLSYDPWGMSLLLTLPLLVLVFGSPNKPRAYLLAVASAVIPLVVSAMFPGQELGL
ncbi:MAG: putative rane protein, partial [Myxococcaceae bacterium]|nr:putative rane protein [Myxococcaceae bacterium]